jgi:hypothetical protein
VEIFEILMFQALGKDSRYRHRAGKENKQCTKLQDFIDEYLKRGLNYDW